MDNEKDREETYSDDYTNCAPPLVFENMTDIYRTSFDGGNKAERLKLEIMRAATHAGSACHQSINQKLILENQILDDIKHKGFAIPTDMWGTHALFRTAQIAVVQCDLALEMFFRAKVARMDKFTNDNVIQFGEAFNSLLYSDNTVIHNTAKIEDCIYDFYQLLFIEKKCDPEFLQASALEISSYRESSEQDKERNALEYADFQEATQLYMDSEFGNMESMWLAEGISQRALRRLKNPNILLLDGKDDPYIFPEFQPSR